MITIEDFMKMPFDQQRFIFSTKNVEVRHSYFIIDNDEKKGWYCKSIQIYRATHYFYVRSNLVWWIKYNKKTKKVTSRINKTSNNLDFFFESNLGRRKSWQLFPSHQNLMSNTFMKKVIEGKIKTIKDMIVHFLKVMMKSRIDPDEFLTILSESPICQWIYPQIIRTFKICERLSVINPSTYALVTIKLSSCQGNILDICDPTLKLDIDEDFERAKWSAVQAAHKYK